MDKVKMNRAFESSEFSSELFEKIYPVELRIVFGVGQEIA
jgi:hypothetical protein